MNVFLLNGVLQLFLYLKTAVKPPWNNTLCQELSRATLAMLSQKTIILLIYKLSMVSDILGVTILLYT